ncbi:MAG: DEAD/DEAH box helicase, partial [Gemmatimonadetes bacterium]|nr:DEAD/DEAH box helicase [Gemmatimonadota bacterium]
MTLLPQHSPPFEEVWVALDLETTGLSPKKDRIIEIGAVKFQGHEVLDTFQSFVNPGRRLSPFIRRFTGITQAQVNEAPPFSSVVGQFALFVGSSPVVGHNLGFDLGFLESEGLKLSNPRCDTWDLAYVMRPGLPEYSLSRLAARMNLQHDRPHRAVDDALATKEVFVTMVEEASKLDVYTLAEMSRLAARSSWVLGYVLKGLEAQKSSWQHGVGVGQDIGTGATGVDMKEISARLHQGRSLRATKEPASLDLDVIASMLRSGGPFSRSIPAFEERTEQVEMALAVGKAINEGQRLIVEAGTGVGKSLAYLLPAALYALMNDKRVVISTNTINLQEQLANKDLPDLVNTLRAMDSVDAEELKFTQLKGRANYLCLRRFSHMRSSESLADNEARLLAKAMVWLKDTSTGDRSEINLGNRNSAAPWERLSAQGAVECLSTGGPCFLRAARERAAASHIVVVNHALLLSDVIAGGTLIPDYDILIIDEAHHLEDEATRHFGFELAQGRFDEYLQSLTGDRGLLNEAVTAFRTVSGLAEAK